MAATASPLGQPDFMPGAAFRRDRGEALFEVLKPAAVERLVQPAPQL